MGTRRNWVIELNHQVNYEKYLGPRAKSINGIKSAKNYMSCQTRSTSEPGNSAGSIG